MVYVQIQIKHISKWKGEPKENKVEGKHRAWKDKDEIKNFQIIDFKTELYRPSNKEKLLL